jgi:hypothetical protein
VQPSELETRRSLIAQLFAADRGKRADEAAMEAYLLALKHMETPRLARVVERLLEKFQYGDAEPYRVPQAGTLWRIAKEMRYGAAPPEKPADNWSGDGWDVNANLLLLSYLRDHDVTRYAPDSPKPSNPGPETIRRTAILVKWKDLWARDMREDRQLGGNLDGKKAWADCMSQAEHELDRLSEREAA